MNQDDITPLQWAEQAYEKFTNLGVKTTFEKWSDNKHNMNRSQLDNIVTWLRDKEDGN